VLGAVFEAVGPWSRLFPHPPLSPPFAHYSALGQCASTLESFLRRSKRRRVSVLSFAQASPSSNPGRDSTRSAIFPFSFQLIYGGRSDDLLASFSVLGFAPFRFVPRLSSFQVGPVPQECWPLGIPSSSRVADFSEAPPFGSPLFPL